MKELAILLMMCVTGAVLNECAEVAAVWQQHPWATLEEVHCIVASTPTPRGDWDDGVPSRGGRANSPRWSHWLATTDLVFLTEARLRGAALSEPSPRCPRLVWRDLASE